MATADITLSVLFRECYGHDGVSYLFCFGLQVGPDISSCMFYMYRNICSAEATQCAHRLDLKSWPVLYTWSSAVWEHLKDLPTP